MIDLKAIYLTALGRCAPEKLVRRVWREDMPRNVVAIGKCALRLLEGVEYDEAFAAVPEGYGVRRPRRRFQERRHGRRTPNIAIGGHPHMTRASFEAGRRLLEFVDAHEDILLLVSGGGSACVEVPLPPHTEDELNSINAQLIASGKPISEINAVRKQLSAIKGGKLAARVRGRCVTLVYSDVSTGRLDDVASGPGRDPILIADNNTLVDAAMVPNACRLRDQIECGVEAAAQQLSEQAALLKDGEILVAGGEPTVVVRGNGRGGRCCELAVRFAQKTRGIRALFASSDGVDGNSGCAGILLPAERFESGGIAAALLKSDSFRVAAQLGEPIMIAPTGNNLRDLYLLARG